MHRGFIKYWRKIEDSAVWHMPALHLKVFLHILTRANWSDKLMPTNSDYGIWVSRGMWITSIDRVAEGVSFYERGVERKPNKRTIYGILEWLKANAYILCESNAHGTGIFVINYNTYNDSSCVEVTPTAQQHALPSKRQMHTTKEVKEIKEGKERKTTLVRKAIAYSHEYEELWRVHNYGAKTRGWEEYKLMDNPPPHPEMLEILKSHVQAEKESRDNGSRLEALPHLERWIKRRMWEKGASVTRESALSVTKEQKAAFFPSRKVVE